MSGLSGVGLGLRPELAGDLLRRPDPVSFVEVVAESCFVLPHARREAQAFAEMFPVVPHGVKLSLGSAEGIDRGRARSLGALARELRAPAISEHVAFVRSGEREIGHLTALPLSREAISVVAKNVAHARRHLPDVPLYLENVAWSFPWPDAEMSEGDFYSEIQARTGCELLLDLGNLYANAINSGADPQHWLEAFPLERVGMIHIAGGTLEDDFYFDDHAHPVPAGVFQLLDRVLNRSGSIPIILERDAAFPPFSELAKELDRARRALCRAQPRARSQASVPSTCPTESTGLRALQDEMAALLTDVGPLPDSVAARFDVGALHRSREILARKRVDEAIPLLPLLSRHRQELEPLAHEAVRNSVRAPRLAGPSDALRIAESALEQPELHSAARRDQMLLRARFVVDAASGWVTPRALPFLARAPAENGKRIWSVKGPGTRARVRLSKRGGSDE